jgi:hypothetical protein
MFFCFVFFALWGLLSWNGCMSQGQYAALVAPLCSDVFKKLRKYICIEFKSLVWFMVHEWTYILSVSIHDKCTKCLRILTVFLLPETLISHKIM